MKGESKMKTKRLAVLLSVLFVCVCFAGVFACGGEENQPEQEETVKTYRILYQGDSITDAMRVHSDEEDLGNGYARMVSESLSETYEDKVEFEFINQAKSGWKLIKNWNGDSSYEQEFYQYEADITTILIGFNDIMAHSWNKDNPYVTDSTFREAYDRLLQGLKERGTYAICLAPYFVYDYADKDYAEKEFTNKRAIVKSLAQKYEFGYIDMKPAMTAAIDAGTGLAELFYDGTHPLYAANKIIAGLVTDAIRTYIDENYTHDESAGRYEHISAPSDNAEDLTNTRLYVYTTLGDVSYDKEIYCSGDMTSSQSVKLTSRGNYECSYTKVAFVFDDDKKPDLSSGYLEFDLKIDNAVQRVYFTAHGSFWWQTNLKVSDYSLNLTDTDVCTDLGNGWYHLKVSLDDWKAHVSENVNVLSGVKQLVIGVNRGDNASLRNRYDIDPERESVMWIDNLHVTAG